MASNRITTRTLAGLTLLAGFATGQAGAQSKPEEVLARTPVQPNVAVSTPTGADATACRVSQVNWPAAGNVTPKGVVVKDAQGRTLRQFVDTNGRGNPNLWSYFLNGVEAYREMDGNGDGKPDQYRWVGPNGGKWGIDNDQDGTVDVWHNISQAELSQELFQAMLTRDPKRLNALFPTANELQALNLPKDEADRILQRVAGAAKRIQDTGAALGLTEKSKWVHAELAAPHVVPADAFGGRDDLIKQPSTTVLFDKGDGKSIDPFQTGEMILIGRGWRLIDGPAVGAATPETDGTTGPVNPAVVQILETKMSPIKFPADPTPANMAKYHLARAAVLEELVGKTQGAEQEPWLRQVIDSYAAAAEANPGEEGPLTRLHQWRDQVLKIDAKGGVAAYVSFRTMAAENTLNMVKAKPEDVAKVQAAWRGQLEAFTKTYPNAEETPEAMLRLAYAFELSGKEGEATAKTWFETLAKSFPNHAQGARAQGAVKRLTSDGQPFALGGQTLDGKPFAMPQLAGQTVIVAYWATWAREYANDLKALAELAKTYGGKGLVLVTVNLDEDPAKAVQALTAAQLPGVHLHLPGGVDRSPHATAYGIEMVPHLFVVNKEGKVANRNAQIGPMLKDEVEKLTK